MTVPPLDGQGRCANEELELIVVDVEGDGSPLDSPCPRNMRPRHAPNGPTQPPVSRSIRLQLQLKPSLWPVHHLVATEQVARGIGDWRRRAGGKQRNKHAEHTRPG